MSKRRYRPEEIIAKPREADVLLSQGSAVADVVKAIGIHEVTYYRTPGAEPTMLPPNEGNAR